MDSIECKAELIVTKKPRITYTTYKIA
jgi:hypothetical protein